MARQLPVERTLVLRCGVCTATHDVDAVGPYDINRRISYRSTDGSGHEWVGDVRVWLNTPDHTAEARRQGFEIEPWDSH